MAISVSGTTLTFNDGTTQTTAAGVASFGGIGSTTLAVIATTTNLLPGSTIAGSSCYYVSTVNVWNSSNIFTENTTANTKPYTTYFYTSVGPIQYSPLNTGYVIREVTGNVGFQAPGGHTALTGTWRILSLVKSRFVGYYNCCGANTTQIVMGQAFIERIS
jgi:hypothetical protein